MTAELSDVNGPATVTARLRRPATVPGPGAVRMLLLHGLAGNGRVWQEWEARADAVLELWDAELPWGSAGSPGWAADPDAGRWLTMTMASMPPVHVVVAHSFAATTLLEVLDRGDVPWPRAVALVSPFYRRQPSDFDWHGLTHTLGDFSRLIEEGVGVYARRDLEPGVRRGIAGHIRDRIGPQGWLRFMDMYMRTPVLRTDRLRLPVLAVCGDGDVSARPSDSLALGAALPSCRVEILPDCGHFPMVEQPDLFAGVVHSFLDAALPAPPADHAVRQPSEVT